MDKDMIDKIVTLIVFLLPTRNGVPLIINRNTNPIPSHQIVSHADAQLIFAQLLYSRIAKKNSSHSPSLTNFPREGEKLFSSFSFRRLVVLFSSL